MKRIAFLTIALALVMAVIGARPTRVLAHKRVTLDQVRDATDAYHTVKVAQAAGYDLVPGLDYCFYNPGVGGMGYHYINLALLDIIIDPLKPEAMVYAPRTNGTLRLAAVEYIVPVAAWDAVHSEPPTLFGHVFGVDQDLGVYELHAWIWKHNSLGMFFEWNPKVFCY
jgi:hypothetical protein